MQQWLQHHGFPVTSAPLRWAYVPGGSESERGTAVTLDPAMNDPRTVRTTDRLGNEIHGLLHTLNAAWPTWSTLDLNVEEGSVEAVAEDLLPRVARFRGIRPPFDRATSYDDWVAWVRRTSALATGAPASSAKAKEWRADFVRANPQTRRDMVQHGGSGGVVLASHPSGSASTLPG